MTCEEIWVVCDRSDNCDYPHIRQVVSKAAGLAKVNHELITVVCIGQFQEEQLRVFGAYGADSILLCRQEGTLSEHEFSDILGEMILKSRPKLILFMASLFGKAVAARMSIRFESGLTADCIDIEIDGEDRFVFSRAALNSSVIARIVCVNSAIQMCTVKNNVFVEQRSFPDKQAQIIDFTYVKKVEFPSYNILSVELAPPKDTTSIHDSKLIFALGRGLKGKENVALLSRVANKYNAQVVGTRAAVEEQLIEKEFQVGQSGVSIAPEIYIGFGISGATQHIVGILNSKTVIAVNTDQDAPIFNFTDYAVIGDAVAILSELDKLI